MTSLCMEAGVRCSAAVQDTPSPGNSTCRIALDVGNVIALANTDDGVRPSDLMCYTPSNECVDAVWTIVQQVGACNVFVLSKCRRTMQQATIVMFGRSNFFHRTGLRPSNVLFCTECQGGKPPADKDMLPVSKPEDSGIFDGWARYFVPGPRYAPDGTGKGALAKAFGLTTLLDDKVECLRSFYWEGTLRRTPNSGKMLQAIWGRNVRCSAFPKKHIPCRTWDDVLIQLEELKEHDVGNAFSDHEASCDRTDVDVSTCVESEDALDRTYSLGASSSYSGASYDAYETLVNADAQEDERLYRCAECGEAAELGALDEQDDAWYCKECWLSYADAGESNGEPSAADVDADNDSEDGARLFRCAECGHSPQFGAVDENDGQWYCKGCWEALLDEQLPKIQAVASDL